MSKDVKGKMGSEAYTKKEVTPVTERATSLSSSLGRRFFGLGGVGTVGVFGERGRTFPERSFIIEKERLVFYIRLKLSDCILSGREHLQLKN